MSGIFVIISAGFDVMRTGPSGLIVIGGKRPSVKPRRERVVLASAEVAHDSVGPGLAAGAGSAAR